MVHGIDQQVVGVGGQLSRVHDVDLGGNYGGDNEQKNHERVGGKAEKMSVLAQLNESTRVSVLVKKVFSTMTTHATNLLRTIICT